MEAGHNLRTPPPNTDVAMAGPMAEPKSHQVDIKLEPVAMNNFASLLEAPEVAEGGLNREGQSDIISSKKLERP